MPVHIDIDFDFIDTTELSKLLIIYVHQLHELICSS